MLRALDPFTFTKGSAKVFDKSTLALERTCPLLFYSSVQGERLSEVFASEKEMWAYVRSNGYCYEVSDREDHEPKRVLDGAVPPASWPQSANRK
jgi:hypothetical protein